MRPEERDDVRRLLAGLAAHDVARPPSVPPEVAARLERTLAGLADDGSAAAEDVVLPLRSRLTRYWRPALAAAAAVVVVAGGGALLADDVLGGGGAGESAQSGASVAEPTPETPSEDQLRSAGPPPPALSSDDLGREVGELLRSEAVVPGPGAAERRRQDRVLRAQGCEPPDGAGALAAVTLDGEPGSLLVGSRSAAVFDCTGEVELARTPVPTAGRGR